MKDIKLFLGLQREDLKSKSWLVLLSWYVMGMFCFLFATKNSIPEGEIRSLYVGPGNTSFFAVMTIFGILMGITGFRYLNSDRKADLLFSLPFSKKQLFLAGWLNDLLIFAVPAVVCRIVFFRISLSMGYCQYENSKNAVWIGCLVVILGFLFLYNLSMLAHFLTQNIGYTLGILFLFLLGPGLGLHLAERMLGIFVPSFYRSAVMESLGEYLPPFSLLKNAAGIEGFQDGADWILGEHLPYVCVLAVLALALSGINCLIFQKRPVERQRGVFTFSFVEYPVRYLCVFLAVLWLADVLQIFSLTEASKGLVVGAVLFGVPVVHGPVNVLMSFDIKKFISGKWHLLAEYAIMGVFCSIFFMVGKAGGAMPAKESLDSMAVVLTAIDSGDQYDQALSEMDLKNEELSAAYDWIRENCAGWQEIQAAKEESYELLVRYGLKEGKEKYCRYYIPWYALDGFEAVFQGKEFKEGMFSVLVPDSLKYYEIRWTNGLESYVLDLSEEERKALWAAYYKDFLSLSFSDFRQQVPIGCFTLCSTKDQGDKTGYIYPGFTRTRKLLVEYGIEGEKGVRDYEIIRICADKYLVTEGVLYDTRALAWEKDIRKEPEIRELAEDLHYEEFCVDTMLNRKDPYLDFTVYYRDSSGRTVNHVKCRVQADPGENEVLRELMR